MAHHRLEIHVDASPEQTWALWTDIERMREWVGGVTRVSDVSGSLDRAGTRYTVWFGKMSSPTEVLASDPPRLLRTKFGNRVLAGEAQVTLEPEAGGTRLVQEFWTRGVIPAIAGRIFAAGSYKGSFRGELNEFARIVERESKAGT